MSAVEPHEEHWEVFIEWAGRKALSPLSMKAMRSREARMRERARNWLDVSPDGCIDLDELVAIIVILMVIALLFLLAPIVFVLLLAIVEVAIAVAVAGAAVLLKTLLNRPWRVVAISSAGETWAWKQVGWQRARELVERIERELAAGANPAMVAPGDATPEGQSFLPADTPTHLVESAGVRLAAKIGAMFVVALALAVLLGAIG